MCGIFGYIGPQDAVGLTLEGIKSLDYRGYDSAGIALLSNGNLYYEKQVGKVSMLEDALAAKMWKANQAVAHTRWATHGKPTVANAHPHLDTKEELAVVHNGIIENHDAMRKMLQKKGVVFRSETDTEVISHLIATLYQGDFLKAVQRAVLLLRGAFAIAAIHKNHPDEMVCATKECPLSIGVGQGENYVSSDSAAFLKYTKHVIYLHSQEVALIRAGSIDVFDANQARVVKKSEEVSFSVESVGKGCYQHYMQKEIFDQPQTALYALLSRYSEEGGNCCFRRSQTFG